MRLKPFKGQGHLWSFKFLVLTGKAGGPILYDVGDPGPAYAVLTHGM